MGEFMLYVLKLNLWTACCICAAILAGKAAVRRYLKHRGRISAAGIR